MVGKVQDGVGRVDEAVYRLLETDGNVCRGQTELDECNGEENPARGLANTATSILGRTYRFAIALNPLLYRICMYPAVKITLSNPSA